ncbi:helix-turn-helix transcriptional regulator [Microbulbifer sediminum]|uniref:helix-turn-helix transcriptional regulator n=1 Tax=Microbulbifer sediminum TaxID=2904250 RepID=UPI001F2CA049|nr:AraC family transcriptional regulator [Microbulbifer sediminum]
MFLVRAGAIQGFEQLVSKLGGNPARVLRTTGFSDVQLRDPDTYVSYVRIADLLDSAARACDAPLFGLQLAAAQPALPLGEVIVLSIRHQTSLWEALEHAQSHISLHAEGLHIRQLASGDRVELQLQFDFTNASGLLQLMQLSAAHAFNTIQQLVKTTSRQPRLHLPQWEPPTRYAVPERYAERVIFASEFCGVSYPASWTNRKPRDDENLLRDHFRQRIEELEARHPGHLPTQVRHVISGLLASGECSLERVGASLDLHPRVLQRRLRGEGTSFRQLLRDTREELARQHLQHGEMTITELALNLGYADIAVFSRNFKRWTGLPPRQWRERNRGDD